MNRRGFVNEKVTEESVASHPDPESCAVSREAAIEALTAGTCRQVLSCERIATEVPTPFSMAEGNIDWCAIASIRRTLRSADRGQSTLGSGYTYIRLEMGFLYLYDGAGCLGPRDRVVAGSYAGRTNWQSRRYGWGSSAARGARLGEPFSMRPTTTGLCCRSTTSTSVQAAKTIWSSTRNEWRECRSAETTGGLHVLEYRRPKRRLVVDLRP
jgi:hypothetical protein